MLPRRTYNWVFILSPCTAMQGADFTREPIYESDDPKIYSGGQLHNCCHHLPSIGNITPDPAFWTRSFWLWRYFRWHGDAPVSEDVDAACRRSIGQDRYLNLPTFWSSLAILAPSGNIVYQANKKNPARVSTGEVLGFANNWRSLDSRAL